MEANLLTAEPSALPLVELQQGYGDQEPEADACEERGKDAGVEGSSMVVFPIRPTSIALAALVVAQLVWVALLVYGAYLAAVWLPL